MLAYVKKLSSDSAWHQVETLRCDEAAVPFEDASFTHVLSNLGIFFSPDDGKVLPETLRLLHPGDIAGSTSWKYLGWWHDLAVPVLGKCFPDAPMLPHPSAIFLSKGGDDAELLRSQLESAGFKDVAVDYLAFAPKTEDEGFAVACAFPLNGMAARLWWEEVSARYAERLEPEFLRILREKYQGGKWNGAIVALIGTGRKEHPGLVDGGGPS